MRANKCSLYTCRNCNCRRLDDDSSSDQDREESEQESEESEEMDESDESDVDHSAIPV